MADQLTTPLDYAQAYAGIGWAVIPLHWINEAGKCSCVDTACRAPGKHPLTLNGVKAASKNLSVLAGWWARWPQANVGVATGQISGISVVDVDPRNGGETPPGMPNTVTALTGGGGFHYVFAHRTGLPGKLGPGIDVKNDGGYIVVEPSNHSSGKQYAWEASSSPLEGVSCAEFPANLLPHTAVTESPVAAGDAFLPPNVLNTIRTALSFINPDDREAWIAVGQALKASGAKSQAFGLWDEWSKGSEKYDPSDMRKRWEGFAADRSGLGAIINRAKANGWVQPPLAAVPNGRDGLGSRRIETRSHAELLALNFPPVDWVVGDLIAPGLTLLVGAPKIGKSWLALQISIAVAGGYPLWAGRSAERQGRVLYLALEDSDRRLHDRLRKQSVNRAGSTALFDPVALQDLEFATRAPAFVDNGLDAIRQAVVDRPGLRLLIIDTLGRFRGAAQQRDAYRDDTDFAAAVKQVADDLNIAIVLVHHSRKLESADYVGRVSGTFGLTGAADTILLLDRSRNGKESTLQGTGRDLPEEIEWMLRFSDARWSQVSPAEIEQSQTQLQQQVIAYVLQNEACGSAQVAEALGKNANSVKTVLNRSTKQGMIRRIDRGRYGAPVTDAGSDEGSEGLPSESIESSESFCSTDMDSEAEAA